MAVWFYFHSISRGYEFTRAGIRFAVGMSCCPPKTLPFLLLHSQFKIKNTGTFCGWSMRWQPARKAIGVRQTLLPCNWALNLQRRNWYLNYHHEATLGTISSIHFPVFSRIFSYGLTWFYIFSMVWKEIKLPIDLPDMRKDDVHERSLQWHLYSYMRSPSSCIPQLHLPVGWPIWQTKGSCVNNCSPKYRYISRIWYSTYLLKKSVKGL